MKIPGMIFLAVVMCGCGKVEPPLAGGKQVGYWTKALKDPDAKLRKKAVTKLGNVGATDAAVFPALIEALKDPDASIRGEAILALMKFGPDAKEALPILSAMQHDDRDGKVRSFAAKALEKLHGAK